MLRGRSWEARRWNGPVLALDDRLAARIGADILGDAVVGVLIKRLRGLDQAARLGEALLDQRVIAGIGNMWMAEALWQARISPCLCLGDVRDDELSTALSWARSAMRARVAGRSGPARAVYRRVGRACSRCGETIAARGLGDANRRAYWCPGCQRQPG